MCLQTEAGGDRKEIIMLLCGYKFHNTCEGHISLMPDVVRRYRQLAGRQEHLPVLSCACVGPRTLSLPRQNATPQRSPARTP